MSGLAFAPRLCLSSHLSSEHSLRSRAETTEHRLDPKSDHVHCRAHLQSYTHSKLAGFYTQ